MCFALSQLLCQALEIGDIRSSLKSVFQSRIIMQAL